MTGVQTCALPISAATGIDYAMGVLTADADADLLDPSSWTKSRSPVFVSDPAAERYGPGHNSFTTTADGEVVLVYHARTYTRIEGNPLYDPNRHACAQVRSEEHTSELQSRGQLVCRLLLEKKN